MKVKRGESWGEDRKREENLFSPETPATTSLQKSEKRGNQQGLSEGPRSQSCSGARWRRNHKGASVKAGRPVKRPVLVKSPR